MQLASPFSYHKPKLLAVLVCSAMISACSTTKVQKKDNNQLKNHTFKSLPITKAKPPVVTKKAYEDKGVYEVETTETDNLEELLQASDKSRVYFKESEMKSFGDVWDRMRAGFLLDLGVEHRRIEDQKGWFISRQTYIDKLVDRASYYIYYTVTEAQRRGIPSELALLPIIESSYDPSATSNADAAGMWQFIPSTGKIYGLQQTANFDGRRDVIESTRAAYDFLTSLYNKFGSWELALAAYNAGPGRVQEAINQNRANGYPTDFWSLSLPKETMDYVPRFLAVAQIVNQPNRYKINLNKVANRPFFKSIAVSEGLTLKQISTITGLDIGLLQDLNPSLLKDKVMADTPKRVLVPATMHPQLDDILFGFNPNKDEAMYVDMSFMADKLKENQKGNSHAKGGHHFENYEDHIISSKKTEDRLQIIASQQENKKAYEKQLKQARQKFYQSKNRKLPKGGSALARFASKSIVPKQKLSYIPINPNFQAQTSPNKVKTPKESGLSEQQILQAQVLADINALPTTSAKVTKRGTVVAFPALSVQERKNIASEMKKSNPKLGKVIDPLDGEIKLESIQTQQSILEAQGKKKSITFKQKQTSSKAKQNFANKAAKKPTGERVIYKVKRGDTLKKIAQRFNLYWRDIAEWNQINPSKSLYVGTPLYLYGAKNKNIVTNKKPTSYVVQKGDTMIGVANEFGLSPTELASLNGMKALDNLVIGQRLALVKNKSMTKNSSAKQATSRQSNKPTQYKVQPGDGLIQIAKKFGVSTQVLASYNKLSKTQNLYVGQILRIPTSKQAKAIKHSNKPVKTTPVSYRVKSGDTMIGVANKFGMSTSTLAKINNMKPLDKLVIGKTLTLVANKNSKYSGWKSAKNSNKTKKVTKTKTKKSVTTYVVERGDTMIYVARKFKISTNQLAKLNGLKPFDNLKIGMKLNLVETKNTKRTSKNKSTKKSANNKASKNPSSYKVKAGDGLISIAKKFKTTTKKLAKLNKLAPSAGLKVGQTLKIPK